MKNQFTKLFQILSIGLLASMLVFSQVKPDPKIVLFRASVTDKANFVENLKKEQFTIKEDGTEQEISYFSHKDEPASVVILLDLSESITQTVLQLNVKSVAKFIDQSNFQNEYSIIGFGPEVSQLTDWKDKGSRINDVLNKIITSNFNGNTRFYDAITLAFEKFKTGKHDKKVLLIFSDGQDNESKDESGDVRKALKRNDVVIYSIAILNGADTSTMTGMQGVAFLDEMAGISGGKSYYPITIVENSEVIELVVAAVRKQYVIGYVPKESKTKKDWRSVKIKASTTDEKGKEKSLAVRARNGYFTAEEKPE